MIGRIWHGWTSPENADAYEALLKAEIFPGIAAKGVEGYRGIRLLRRPLADEVEFVTLMWFESWAAVKAFAGETTKPPMCRRKRASSWRGSTRVRSTTICARRGTAEPQLRSHGSSAGSARAAETAIMA